MNGSKPQSSAQELMMKRFKTNMPCGICLGHLEQAEEAVFLYQRRDRRIACISCFNLLYPIIKTDDDKCPNDEEMYMIYNFLASDLEKDQSLKKHIHIWGSQLVKEIVDDWRRYDPDESVDVFRQRITDELSDLLKK